MSAGVFKRSSSKLDGEEDDEGDGPTIPTNIVGKFITETHKQYALTYAMMLGIRTTLSAPTEEEFQNPDRDLEDLQQVRWDASPPPTLIPASPHLPTPTHTPPSPGRL